MRECKTSLSFYDATRGSTVALSNYRIDFCFRALERKAKYSHRRLGETERIINTFARNVQAKILPVPEASEGVFPNTSARPVTAERP
jgi:hypothetical protein